MLKKEWMMDRREYSRRPTAEQVGALLRYLDGHRNLARGALRHRAHPLWLQLAAQLNAVPGGTRKDAKSWSKCWADLKSRVKKKQSSVSGETSECLTELELRILAVTSAVEGDGEGEAHLPHTTLISSCQTTTKQRRQYEINEWWLEEELLELEEKS